MSRSPIATGPLGARGDLVERSPSTSNREPRRERVRAIVLHADQLRSAVELIEVLARVFGVARVLPWREGAAELRVLGAVRAGRYAGLQGLFAHANFTEDRGPGDPGPGAFGVLRAKGWVGVGWG
ncbi:MAG: hypothetical protein Q8Q09_18210 [Deltaproteobacteria bacterium]|nr:hypothetical protein [Deltaproteobacteria bacterium]